MASELVPADSEGALRDYLRAHTGVQSVLGTRVFFGVPDNNVAFPCAAITRIGGTVVTGNADEGLYQVDVWGEVRNKAGCWAATAQILGALKALQYTPATIAGKATLYSPGASSWAFLPNPDDERARYSITVPVVAIPAD